jgi:hypothetical protein
LIEQTGVQCPAPPIIVSTSFEVLEAIPLGRCVVGYMVKPIDVVAFAAMLTHAFAKHDKAKAWMAALIALAVRR